MVEPIRSSMVSADQILDTVREPLLILSSELRVLRANRSFFRTFDVNPMMTIGRQVYDLGNRQWDIPALRKLLEEILPQRSTFDDYEVRHEFESIGPRVIILNARSRIDIYLKMLGLITTW